METTRSSVPRPDWENDQVRLPSGVTVPVRATARRRQWDTIPDLVRHGIEEQAGAGVVSVQTTGTGFTPGFASRLDLADGRSIFVKAASTEDDRRHGWGLSSAYRVEARNLRLLPRGAGAIPLLWTWEVRHADEDWVVLGFPYVVGRPPRRPWLVDELRLVTDRLAETAPALASAPLGLDLEPFAAAFGQFSGWIDRVRERDGESAWLDTVSALAVESPERCCGTAVGAKL